MELFENKETIQFVPVEYKNGIYSSTIRKAFKPSIDVNEYTEEVINWALKNHFKADGRTKVSIVRNATVGKFSEFALYKHFKSFGYDVSYPDLAVREKGQWDDGDLIIEGNKVSVKSSTFSKANLFMHKKGDWNSNGEYKYGKDGFDSSYKAFFFCRLNQDLKKIITDEFFNTASETDLIDHLQSTNFMMDCPGFITVHDFKLLETNNMTIREGQIVDGLNVYKNTYYCQAGQLRDLSSIKRKKNAV
jgi:hypothetical protein